MTRLLRSEALKAATAPVTYGLLAAILVMTALNTGLPLSDAHADLMVAQTVEHALGASRDFTVLFVALGAVGAAAEFRHRTAIPTFLAAPRRARLVEAKLAVYLVVGMLGAAVAGVLQLGIVLPWAAANGHALAPWDAAVLAPLLTSVVAGACYTAFGVAIGLLVRNQLAALIVAIGWFTVVEAALAILAPGVSRFLPGGALSGVDTQGLHLLPLFAAVPLVAAWVAAVSALAVHTTLGRDVS
jgi:hypothetical protein